MSTTEKKKSILGTRGYYKPFGYEKFYEHYKTHFSMMWTPEETKLDDDVYDWNNTLTKAEKHFLTNIFRFFTEADVSVAGAYAEEYLPLFKLPEVRMMLLDFAAREAVHIRAYSYLIDTIGMPSTTYKAFYDYEVMVEKHTYFESFKDEGEVDIRRLLKQIAAFSAFTEGMQLFSSFIMLLNFSRFNKMKGMGELIRWSIRDEECLDADTLVLTPTGYKKIDQITIEDEVYQYNTSTKSIEVTKPLRVANSTKSTAYLLTNEEGLVIQRVTGNHRVLYEGVDGNIEESKAENLQEGKLYTLPSVNNSVVDYTVAVSATKEELPHEEKFYCITVPSGAFAISYNQVNSVTGNCHYNGMSDIFKTLLKENLEYHTDDLKEEIYDIARKMVDLEDKFIDLCFEMGGIEGLTSQDTKTYIRYICDRRLIGLGYKGIYKVKTNPLPWVEEMLNVPGHANFFEVRSTDYSRGAHTGSWTNFWQQPIKPI